MQVIGNSHIYKHELNNYYPFGMQMPGVGYRNADGYLFGFNGQEQTPELDPSHTTALFWEYDARLGRRWNTDPITYPWQSPYACFNNSPLYFVDPFGLEGEDPKKGDTFVGDDGKTYTCNVGAATCTAKALENTSVNEITETITNDLKEVAVSDNTYYHKQLYDINSFEENISFIDMIDNKNKEKWMQNNGHNIYGMNTESGYKTDDAEHIGESYEFNTTFNPILSILYFLFKKNKEEKDINNYLVSDTSKVSINDTMVIMLYEGVPDVQKRIIAVKTKKDFEFIKEVITNADKKDAMRIILKTNK